MQIFLQKNAKKVYFYTLLHPIILAKPSQESMQRPGLYGVAKRERVPGS